MESESEILDLNEAKELGASMLRSGHQVQFRLGGNSMFPFLKNGDVAVVEKLPIAQLKLGQVVVFEQQGKWIAHRLVKIIEQRDNTTQFMARGDSTRRSDFPFTEKEYLGVVLRFKRAGKQHEMSGIGAAYYAKLMRWFRPIPQLVIHFFLRIKHRLEKK